MITPLAMGKMLAKLAWQSLWFRRGAVLVTIGAIAVSVFTLLSVEHLRQAAKQSFNSTVSGVDLIVGPRTGDINLLLTTVFRIGQPSQNMSWQSYQNLARHPNVSWSIPISLGDSHRGFRVVGTEDQFFTHFRHGQSRPLSFSDGSAFSNVYDVVLGASVARQLGYQLDQKLIIAHGLGNTSFHKHDAYPFSVRGILKPTGTPVDNALYVSLASLEAIHLPPTTRSEVANSTGLVPQSISAAMVGLTTKLSTFKVQRAINTSKDEPLTAILPGVTLTQLWQISSGVESTLALMAQLILLASLLGLGAVIVATLRERSYELSVLRTLGAGTFTIFILLQLESLLIAVLGITLGALSFLLVMNALANSIAISHGIEIGLSLISTTHGLVILYVAVGALAVSALPALLGSRGSR